MKFKVSIGKKPQHDGMVSCVGWTVGDDLFSCGYVHSFSISDFLKLIFGVFSLNGSILILNIDNMSQFKRL